MFKISGLDELGRQLTDAQKALEALDGELGTVSFDPDDPASIEAAIQSVETIVDEQIGSYASNPIIAPLADEMKEKYREAVIDRAAEARLKGSDDNAK
ncbi:MAG: hypothetical protein KKE84_11045 [Gammaproteobacteria bacterium]|nr:hypothetical protein [Gammaproteobacteria bacterium]